jgi:hypothetical protein
MLAAVLGYFCIALWVSTPWIYARSRPFQKGRLTLGEMMAGIGVVGIVLGMIVGANQPRRSQQLHQLCEYMGILLMYSYLTAFTSRHVPARWEMAVVWILWSLWLGIVLTLPLLTMPPRDTLRIGSTVGWLSRTPPQPPAVMFVSEAIGDSNLSPGGASLIVSNRTCE